MCARGPCKYLAYILCMRLMSVVIAVRMMLTCIRAYMDLVVIRRSESCATAISQVHDDVAGASFVYSVNSATHTGQRRFEEI